MNQFSSSIRYYILAILFILPSCEDRALLKKDAELDLHIKDLKKQVESLQADAGENPGDQSQMLVSFSEISIQQRLRRKTWKIKKRSWSATMQNLRANIPTTKKAIRLKNETAFLRKIKY